MFSQGGRMATQSELQIFWLDHIEHILGLWRPTVFGQENKIKP